METEELDYSDEDLQGGDLNTEDENTLLGIENSEHDASKREQSDYLELDCRDDFQEEETMSTKADQAGTAAEENDPSQRGKSPQVTNQRLPNVNINNNNNSNNNNNTITSTNSKKNKKNKKKNNNANIYKNNTNSYQNNSGNNNDNSNRPSRNRNRINFSPNKQKNFNMKNNSNFQPRRGSRGSGSGSRTRSRSQSFSGSQNRDFNPRFPDNQPQTEKKPIPQNPWMPMADPNLRQNQNAGSVLIPGRPVNNVLPRVPSATITQQALLQQRQQQELQSLAAEREREREALRKIIAIKMQQERQSSPFISREIGTNVPRPAVQPNQLLSAAAERCSRPGASFSNPTGKGLLGAAPEGVLTPSYPLPGSRQTAQIPPLVDSSVAQKKREFIMQQRREPLITTGVNKPGFGQTLPQDRSLYMSKPPISSNSDSFRNTQVFASKPLMDVDMKGNNSRGCSGPNLSNFDTSLKPFESRITDYNKNSDSAAQTFQGERRLSFPTRFRTDNSNPPTKKEPDYDFTEDYSYNAVCHSGFGVKKENTNNNININNYDNRNNRGNFRQNSRNESNNFRSNRNDFHSKGRRPGGKYRIDRREENDLFKNDGRRNDGENNSANFGKDKDKRFTKKETKVTPNETNDKEEKPAISVPEVTPEDKELVLQKKQERFQRFNNPSLVSYESSSQSSIEFTIDKGNSIDNLEIDDDYLKGMEEQKRRREEIMRQKLLKRKSADTEWMPDDKKPFQKYPVAKREVLEQKKNPFGESEMEVDPGHVKSEEEIERDCVRFTGPLLEDSVVQQVPSSRAASTRSAEDFGANRANSPPRPPRSKSPFPTRNVQKQPPAPCAKSPYPARSKTPTPVLREPLQSKSPYRFGNAAVGNADEAPRPKSPYPYANPGSRTAEISRPKSPYRFGNAPSRSAETVTRSKSPFLFGSAASRPVDEIPPHSQSTSPNFVLTEDMLPIRKTIFNEYAFQGSEASSAQLSHVEESHKEDTVFTGCIIKILNFPPSLNEDDLRRMVAPFGHALEVKLNSPRENSAGIRFSTSSSAEAFYKRYHRENIGGNFIDVIVI